MRIVAISFNYKVTSLELREALSFGGDRLALFSRAIVSQDALNEVLILSTCNRTEIYGVGPCVEGVVETIYSMLADAGATNREMLKKSSDCLSDQDAVLHLFRTSSSLNSMVVGEAQILGQLKSSYQIATSLGTAGTYLHKLCHSAFRVAKRVRSETKIAQGQVSVGSVAVDELTAVLGDLTGKNVLVIGAGEMARLVSKHLQERGASISVANRTIDAANTLAKDVCGRVVPFEDWPAMISMADIVITAADGGLLIDLARVHNRIEKDIVFLDLGLPRNCDHSLDQLKGVRLFNIDDLQQIAEKNARSRFEDVANAEAIVSEESNIAYLELQQLKLAPMIETLQGDSMLIKESELALLFERAKDLTLDQRVAIQRSVDLIVSKILNQPIRMLKEEMVRAVISGPAPSTTPLSEPQALPGQPLYGSRPVQYRP